MTKLTWGASGERRYETGLDRGVFYPLSGPGVAWNGLTSVSEKSTGGDVTTHYQDGVMFKNVASSEEFEASLTSYSSPPGFDACDGMSSIAKGLFVTQQPRKTFGFSYRTLVGNDLAGNDHGYKIHLVYNALAAPADRQRSTVGGSTQPLDLTWDISALPPAANGYKPTAHFVIDSRTTSPLVLTFLEMILYGSDSGAPRLITPSELVELFSKQFPPVSGKIQYRGTLPNTKTVLNNFVTVPISDEAQLGPVVQAWIEKNAGSRSLVSDPVLGKYLEYVGSSQTNSVEGQVRKVVEAADGFTMNSWVAVSAEVMPGDYATHVGYQTRLVGVDDVSVSPGFSTVRTIEPDKFTRVTHAARLIEASTADRVVAAEFFSVAEPVANQLKDPKMLDATKWFVSPGGTPVFGAAGTGMDESSEGSYVFAAGNSVSYLYTISTFTAASVLAEGIKLIAREQLKLSSWFKSDQEIPANGVRMSIWFQTFGSPVGQVSYSLTNPLPIPANTWGEVSGLATVPASYTGTPRAYLYFNKMASTPGAVTLSTPSVVRVRKLRIKKAISAIGSTEAEALARVALYFDGSSEIVMERQEARGAWLGDVGASKSRLTYYDQLKTAPAQSGYLYEIEGSLWLFNDSGYWMNLGGSPV